MSDEPKVSDADTPQTDTPDEHPLAGFEEALSIGLGTQDDPERQSEPSEAVDKSDVEETPEVEKPEGEPDTEQESEAELTVNFDGLDDKQKTLWEKLLKDGHASEEEFNDARGYMLRHADYTRKTQKLADERKSFKEAQEKDEADLALLRQIRDDKRLHDIWMKMQSGDFGEAEGGDDELVSRKEAERLLEEKLKAREAEKQARTKKQQAAYDEKVGELREVAAGLMAELSIDAETMNAYITEEGKQAPEGEDPILFFDGPTLRRSLESRHRIAVAEARAKRLEEQLEQRTSKATRTSKQSSPPPQRLSVDTPLTPAARTLQELGVEADGSNVQGFGHPASQI